MSFEISLAHLTVLQLSPPEMIEVAAKTGYQFVSLRMTKVTPTEQLFDLLDTPKNLQITKAALAREGIRVHDVELARMPPDVEPRSYVPMLEIGAELGARSVITQLPDPDRSRAADRFAELCDLAMPLGLKIDLEFPSWTETPNLDSAVQILRAVNRPNAGILVDALHFDRSRSSLEQLADLPAEWFNFVHLCDAPHPIPDSLEDLIFTARAGRSFPGHGDIDLKAIVERIPLVPYSLEIPNHKLMEKLGVETFCLQAREETEKFLKGCYFPNKR
jgi:sugar phosphate isomerase/epimerase